MRALFVVRDAIQRSAGWLESRGIGTPRLDAELLLADVLGSRRIDLFMHPERPLSEDETERYRTHIQRRGAHEPVAYILGTVGFWKHDFHIDRRALQPRPETEGILDVVLKAAGTERDAALRIVDVGTGSGVLAISLALEFPNAQVVAADISEEALSLASENAELHDVRGRVHPLRSDLLERLIERGSRADIIVSNPPYIAESERSLMSPGVERWEPPIALFAENDGFAVIDRLLAQVPQVLAPGGLFVMEFGSPQGAGIRDRAERLFKRWRVLQDYSHHDRLLVVDGPGERAWHKAPAAPAAVERVDGASDEDAVFVTEDDATDANPLLYGGADGRERLPEIDLRDDVEDND